MHPLALKICTMKFRNWGWLAAFEKITHLTGPTRACRSLVSWIEGLGIQSNVSCQLNLPTKIFLAGVPRKVKSSSLIVSMTGVTTCCFPSAIRASNGVSHPKLSKKQKIVTNCNQAFRYHELSGVNEFNSWNLISC